VAAGLEHRIDKYEIEAGDAASRYKEGSQSYPGFSLTDAGSHRRTNKAAYIDVAGNPIADLTVDVAARYEHFSDFGNAKVGKLTSRYDFSPAVALRGTFSNGFRAPTLAEEYYSATNVGPTTAFVQLAPNSAGAKLVGVDGLKPEKSTNLSLGLVLNPAKDVAITLDVYQIKIRDRIVGSGALYGSGGSVNSPAVTAAIKANGNVLDSTVSQTGINIFSNAVDTRSRGLEFVTTINSNYGTAARWTGRLRPTTTRWKSPRSTRRHPAAAADAAGQDRDLGPGNRLAETAREPGRAVEGRQLDRQPARGDLRQVVGIRQRRWFGVPPDGDQAEADHRPGSGLQDQQCVVGGGGCEQPVQHLSERREPEPAG
jgi:outer membrane receptor protein involved in Fe transport